MTDKITIEAMIEGGRATAGPPLGPALGPTGINVTQVIAKINEKTKAFEGMNIPVKVIVDKATKTFEVEVGTPPISALLKKEAKVEKGAKAKGEVVGDVSFSRVLAIASGKDSLGKDKKARVKEIVGTAGSMGITINKKPAKEILAEIEQGKYDAEIEKS